MDDIYVYFADLPIKVNEMIVPCFDGYTIYINTRLSDDGRLAALHHAIRHIVNMDYQKDDVQAIEYNAHNEGEKTWV